MVMKAQFGGTVMPEPLTRRQKQALEVIEESITKGIRPPTIRELGRSLGIASTNGVRYLLDALVRKGYIRRRSRTARGIELVRKPFPDHLLAIPLVGRVAAGEPILAEENIEDVFFMDSTFLTPGEMFALRIRGDSMKEAGIFDGDVVFARKQPLAQPGDIVVAVIGEEATVKRFYPENGRIRLEAANPDYGPIIIDREVPGFRLAGKVVGLLRKM
jgi:repressor LexA